MAVSVVSSLLGIPVRSDTAFVSEIGLLGELRPVHSLEKRISEARRMGFSRVVTPSSSIIGGGMQPTFAQSDKQFTDRATLYSAAVAVVRSGNERAVNR